MVPGTPVLAHEAGAGGVEGGHHVIDNGVRIGRGGVSGYHDGIEGVDSRLNEQVGKGEDHVLEACRNAQHQQLPYFAAINADGLRLHPTVPLQADQVPQYQPGGNILGQNAGQGHAVGGHMTADDEDQVQNDVQDPCNGQIHQGPLRVAVGAQNRVAEVEDAQGRHTPGIDL